MVEYALLSKIYYQDIVQYENAYNERFYSSEAVHLDFRIGEHQAFFLQTTELLRSIIEIQRIDKQIHCVSEMLPKVALTQFSNRCLIDEIVLTNNIEGVHSTRREISALLNELHSNDKRHRFYGLVQKYVMLSEEQEIPLKSCSDVRNLYDELVLSEVKDEDPLNIPDGQVFRKGQVSVVNAAQKEIHNGLYPEDAIIKAMDKALTILSDDNIEPLFRIAIFHYLFGYIHPFYEGNGRTSRFISSYLLAQEYEPLLGYRISYTIKEHVNKYYNAFKNCNEAKNRGDLTPFLIMFVDIVKISIQQLYSALLQRHDKLDYYKDRINSLPGSDNADIRSLYYVLIQVALFADDGISTKLLMQAYNISRTTLNKRLDIIRESELLICKRQGRENVYTLNLEKLDQMLKED